MTALLTLLHQPKVVAFDAYGTLFDVHSAVQRLGSRIGPDASAFSALWRQKQLEYSWVLSLAGAYRDFWRLTQEALDYAFASFPAVDQVLRPDLLAAYRTLSAYPDARELLGRLKAAGHATCILSNGEPGMLADAVASAGLADRLDAVFSVDAVGVFKTAPAAYQMVCSHFGVAPADLLLVSSNRWDVAGAAAFGARAIWVNRAGLPHEYAGLDPVATVPDLNAVG
ncbi:MAG: haloacid dehalogenase type II [Hyphomicrobiales bacterium]|nr:haloacid dehalogenase type II [Hyphomicrobiales bacterium]